jgi:CheY-like chemotaxis protein
MPKALVVASKDLSPELGDTVLWTGAAVERVSATPKDALEVARRERPSLVVVDGADPQTTIPFMQRLREDPVARRTSIAVLSRSEALLDEQDFRRAGANLVLGGRVDPFLWNRRLEVLLYVPTRREARFPVIVDSWSRYAQEPHPAAAWALNISVRGLLIEASEPIDLGTKLDMRFSLPRDQREVRTVGQVVREAGTMGDHPRLGVEFLILLGQAREHISWFVDRSGEA